MSLHLGAVVVVVGFGGFFGGAELDEDGALVEALLGPVDGEVAHSAEVSEELDHVVHIYLRREVLDLDGFGGGEAVDLGWQLRPALGHVSFARVVSPQLGPLPDDDFLPGLVVVSGEGRPAVFLLVAPSFTAVFARPLSVGPPLAVASRHEAASPASVLRPALVPLLVLLLLRVLDDVVQRQVAYLFSRRHESIK